MSQYVKTSVGVAVLVIIVATAGFFIWKVGNEDPMAGQDPGARVAPPQDQPGRACTEEAKLCPDGSAVGRTGPDCEFAPCPDFVGIADKIIVSSPAPEQSVSSPLLILGKARGTWFFEGSFPVELYDGNDKLIASVPAAFVSREPDDTWMTEEFVDFQGELKFAAPKTQSGYLLFKKDNPSGNPALDESFSLPVKFTKPVGAIKKDDPDGSGGMFCTEDAKICPDGSAVGRIGPDCEFAPCPGENGEAAE